jgi:hypothetical protein
MLTMRKEEVLVLGDSHAGVFQQASLQSQFGAYQFKVVAVPGATVSGLSNPNAKTQALPTFLEGLQKTTAKTIIFLIGEVDTGFVIWYRAQRDGVDVAEALERAVVNYQSLLDKAAAIGRVICISAPLPTIRDGHPFGEVANARKEVKATQLQRTELTTRFNGRMRDYCAQKSLTFIDLDPDALGPDGLVHPRLLNPRSSDHHYDPVVYAELIASRLRPFLETM